MQIIEVEQGTAEWQAARRCKVTGTKLEAVMGTGYARAQLIAELIAEKATEQTKTIRPTIEMERGSAEEIFAIRAFEAQTGKQVRRVGVCVSDEFDWLALSPDGLIPEGKGKNVKYTEGVEVKSPDSKQAIFYRMANMIPNEELGLTPAKKPFLGVPADYKWQVVQNFLVNTDLERLHFLVFDQRFIENGHQLYEVVVERSDEVMQKTLEEARKALVKFRADWLAWEDLILPTLF